MPFSLRSQIADILNILEFMKKNYLMAVCLFLVVMSGCGNKEQAPQQAQSMEAVARKNLTDCQLYAPFPGVIAEKSL